MAAMGSRRIGTSGLQSRSARSSLSGRHIAFQAGPVMRKQRVVLARAADEDAELDARLAKLRLAKGATPYGEGASKAARAAASDAKPSSSPSSSSSSEGAPPAPKRVYDYSGETLYWEGPPARADLAFNIALSATIVCLPISIGAIGRALFVKYRFTDRRLSVATNAPWKTEQTDIAYQEVRDVVTATRLLGACGDMVVTLRNGDKVELRSVERFKELKQYILERRDALGGSDGNAKPPGGIMDLDADDAAAMATLKKPKGFAS